MSMGWKCPGCGGCYAPWVAACQTCAPRTITTPVVPWSPVTPTTTCEAERYGLRAGEYTATHTGPLTREQLES